MGKDGVLLGAIGRAGEGECEGECEDVCEDVCDLVANAMVGDRSGRGSGHEFCPGTIGWGYILGASRYPVIASR